LIRCCLKGDYQVLIGNALFCEYESVISREHIRKQCLLTSSEIADLLAAFISVSEWVPVYYLWRPNLRDEGDNHVVELAIAGNARLIATNNTKDFQGSELVFPDLEILKPEQIIGAK
jgi:putative PIN family toxin of toxin-antitoxin system